MSNIAIKVKNLSKNYKLYAQPVDRVKEALNVFGKQYHTDFKAVSNLSFEIKKGETVGIIGRNGCGKSTLLKMITDVLTPSSGRVIVHGHISAILELGSGFNPEMSGLENIYLNASINGLSKKQTAEKVDDITAFSELGEFIHQPIKTYSSGMKARLAFAVAINVEPDILIIDEALSVGDAAFQRKCFAKMEEIRENGATILFVSHSEASIVSLCNRAIWLSNGEQILDGVPKLVTGLYLKYSNAKQINKKKLLIEYQELINKEDISDEEANNSNKKIENEHSRNIQELYDPEIKPKSTIFYEENGAVISDLKITTPDGIKVNILIQGNEYIYKYKVTFKYNTNKVLCAMAIKSRNGIVIAGGHYPAKNKFIKLNKKSIEVIWNWKCNLLESFYFFNAGISDESGFMHRIVEGYMIKVVNKSDEKISTHLIDLNLNITCN